MIVPRHYEDLGVLHENTLPPRAYYVPASAAADPSPWKREESDRLQLLSGQWSMRYLPSIHDLTEPFWEGGEPVRVPEDGEDAGAAGAAGAVTASDAGPTMLAKVCLLGRLPAADRRACVRRGAAREDRGGCRSARLVGSGTRCYRGLGRRPAGLPLTAGDPGPRHPRACARNAVAR